jgi:hypothetical protein
MDSSGFQSMKVVAIGEAPQTSRTEAVEGLKSRYKV